MRTSNYVTPAGSAKRRILLGMMLGAGLATLTLAGCKSSNASNPADGTTAATDPNATDPTAANSAPVDNSTGGGTTQVAGYQQSAQPTQQSQSYSTAAPIERRAPSSSNQGSSDQGQGYDQNYDQDDAAQQGYDATLSDIQAPQPPPPLPEYAQPEAPDPNYIWTPGYWNYANAGYYWVPGAWVEAPYTGALWTPGYWGGYGSGYRFHRGFWAAHIGFYGGINYGFGYVGTGYQGGYWNGAHFFYNQYANNININLNPGFRQAVYQHNVIVNNTVINNRIVNNTVYNNTTINNTRINNVSYNGGRGGIEVKPRPAELAVLHEQRVPPMQAQLQQAKVASANPQQFYAHNQGRPAEAVNARPLVADRGIAAPTHTTAQINRSAPVQEQVRQQQQLRAQEPARPAAAPAQPQNRREATPVPAQRAVAPQNRPAPAQAQRPVAAQNRPVPVQNRPTPAETRRTEPAQNHSAPVQQARPATPQQATHPAPARPGQVPERATPEARPAARPQPQQARPQPAQSHPQPAQSHPQPQARPQPHPESKPEPHQ